MARTWLPFPLLATVACSSTPASSPAAFPMSVPSDAGQLRLDLTAIPNPPKVGTDTFELTVVDAKDGTPRDGLSMSVVPWMPSMGHGTSIPTVTPEGGGKYVLSDVYLFMPGTWEFKIAFSGPVSDHADPTFEIQ